jgi:hypothetical protein
VLGLINQLPDDLLILLHAVSANIKLKKKFSPLKCLKLTHDPVRFESGADLAQYVKLQGQATSLLLRSVTGFPCKAWGGACDMGNQLV